MANINLSAAVRSNLSSLQGTASLMSKTSDRLSSGNKVNSALDNPTNFFTASALNSRAGDLNQLMDSMANGIKTIEAANNGLTAITKTVESMQSTLRQARQDKSFKGESMLINTTAIGTSQVKNLTISGGAVGTSPVSVALNTTGAATQGTVLSSSDYVAPTAAVAAKFNAGTFSALDMTTGDETYSFTVKGTDDASAITVALNTTDNTGAGVTLDLAETLTGINKDLQTGNSTIRARESLSTSGTIEFYDTNAANTGVGSSLAISIVTAGGTTPTASTASAGLGWAAAQNITGADAQTRTISIGNGAATANIVLTKENAGTAATARAYINSQLSAQGVTGITAGGANNRVDLAGMADGSNAVTVAGTGADSVFGAARTGATAIQGGKVKTVDELVTSINTNLTLADKVKATNDGGKLRIDNLSTQELTIVGASTTGVNGGTGDANTIKADGNDVRKNLSKQFNELRDQLDKLSQDASFNGINLLRGDKLKLTFNEDGTSSIDVQAKNSAGQVRGINTGANSLAIESAAEKNFDSDVSLDGLLGTLSDALTTLRTQSSAFGSNLSVVQNRQDFTKSMINTLETGAGNLTLADMNQEAANMMALQTRQSLASSTLSMANQADQGVLQLLR